MKVSEFFEILKGSEYLEFLEQCKQKNYTGPTEIHHIYPRSFEDGKVQESWNLINLSKVDHLIAHLLLFEVLEERRPAGKSYYSALGAIHTAFKTRYERLSEEERDNLKSQVKSLDLRWEEVQKQWQQRAKESRAKRWDGDCMGACHTPEAMRKGWETRKSRYGYGNGRLGSKEIIEKV